MSDVNAVVIVHFTKHWDNNTKGYIEIAAENIQVAVSQAKMDLIRDAYEDGILLTSTADTGDFFTITKAEFGVPSNWLGV